MRELKEDYMKKIYTIPAITRAGDAVRETNGNGFPAEGANGVPQLAGAMGFNL